MKREVEGSDIEDCGESITWWVGILVSGQQNEHPLLSRKQRSQFLTHHLFSKKKKGGGFEEGTHCPTGGTAIGILILTEAQGYV